VLEYSSEQVKVFLLKLSIPNAQMFFDEQVTGEQLLQMTVNDFQAQPFNLFPFKATFLRGKLDGLAQP